LDIYSVKNPAGRQPPLERRHAPRSVCAGSVCIHINATTGDGATIARSMHVQCRDISRMGIGISYNKPLQVGTEFAVVLREPAPAVILYAINRCSPNTRGSYDIGAHVFQVLHQHETSDSKVGSASRAAFARGLLCGVAA
jgi:hypothetical protein